LARLREEFQKHTKAALPYNAANTNSLDDTLHLVEEQERQFSEFRNKGQVRAVVKDVLNLVESFAAVTGEGVGVVS